MTSSEPLVDKARLLLVRERELFALRQERAQERDWLHRIQKITVALSGASSIVDGLSRLANELVAHAPFEVAHVQLRALAGGGHAALTGTDDPTIGALVASNRVCAVTLQPTLLQVRGPLPWQLVGAVSTPAGLVQIAVARTVRTAGYYAGPFDAQIEHFTHLLHTLEHVLAAVCLRDALMVERNALRDQVAEQTRALTDALGEARQARDLAEAASQAKSVFLANTSHELRTPLNAIIGYAQILAELAEERDDQDALRDLNRIEGSGAHLLAVISDILDMTKIEAGRMDLERAEIEPDRLLAEVCHTARPLCEKHGNQFEAGCDTTRVFMGDPTRVRQILLNLVSNAAKFTANGTVGLWIGEDGLDQLHIVVRDTGLGMTEAQLSRVFEAFQQADSSTTRKHGGTGLGLTITQRLVERMGGTLAVASRPGEGTRFDIRLPRT